jgi:hypothetical protein
MKKFTINNFIVLSACMVILIILSSGNVYSQGRKIELTPFGGYLLGGSLNFYEGKIKIEDAACYGGMLAVEVAKSQFVELSYTRMDSKGDWHSYNNTNIPYVLDTAINLATNYLQIGSVNELRLDNEAIRPYGTITLGTSWIHPKIDNGSDKWLFTFALGGGIKYFFNERIGIRIQARMIVPLIYNGTQFYVGVGYGGSTSGIAVTATSAIVQGDFTGGLIFALGE